MCGPSIGGCPGALNPAELTIATIDWSSGFVSGRGCAGSSFNVGTPFMASPHCLASRNGFARWNHSS